LTRIKTETFIGTCIDCVVLPENVSSITANSFPRGCAVILVDVWDAHHVDDC
jgi:hypothetical protein